MKTGSIVIIIAVVVVIIAAAAAAIMLMGGTATNTQNVSQNGTKVDFQNNNTQAWTHIEFAILNATTKNGTTQTYYGEVWLKPGENKTIDLSNTLGYGNTPLPVGSIVRVDTWTGLFSTNNSGNGNVNLTLRGWSNSSTPPTTDPTYNLTHLNVAIGPLPSNVTSTIGLISINAPDVNTTFTTNFDEELLTEDNNGNLIIVFTTPGGLSQTIARLV